MTESMYIHTYIHTKTCTVFSDVFSSTAGFSKASLLASLNTSPKIPTSPFSNPNAVMHMNNIARKNKLGRSFRARPSAKSSPVYWDMSTHTYEQLLMTY